MILSKNSFHSLDVTCVLCTELSAVSLACLSLSHFLQQTKESNEVVWFDNTVGLKWWLRSYIDIFFGLVKIIACRWCWEETLECFNYHKDLHLNCLFWYTKRLLKSNATLLLWHEFWSRIGQPTRSCHCWTTSVTRHPIKCFQLLFPFLFPFFL